MLLHGVRLKDPMEHMGMSRGEKQGQLYSFFALVCSSSGKVFSVRCPLLTLVVELTRFFRGAERSGCSFEHEDAGAFERETLGLPVGVFPEARVTRDGVLDYTGFPRKQLIF